jgi:hypothetical protein
MADETKTPAPDPKPTVCRAVHYVAFGSPGGEYPSGAHRAAVITAVTDRGEVSLAVFHPAGLQFVANVPEDQAAQLLGSWHWPERP